jgi:hypothetical protein
MNIRGEIKPTNQISFLVAFLTMGYTESVCIRLYVNVMYINTQWEMFIYTVRRYTGMGVKIIISCTSVRSH